MTDTPTSESPTPVRVRIKRAVRVPTAFRHTAIEATADYENGTLRIRIDEDDRPENWLELTIDLPRSR